MQAKIDEFIPSWDNAPEWANWLTYAKEGWHWWKAKPFFSKVSMLYVPSCGDKQFMFVPAAFPIPEKVTMAIYSRPESHKKVSK